MDMLTELSLFSGYGGFSLGLRLAGIQVRTVMYVEWERYPQEILKARIKDGFLDDAPIWGDISTLDGEQLNGVVASLRQGSHASLTPSQGSSKGLMTLEISGLRRSELSVRWNPNTSSWKTYQVSFLHLLTGEPQRMGEPWSESLPPSGTVSIGKQSELTMWAHPTDASGGGASQSWMTPNVEDASRVGSEEAWGEYTEQHRTTQARLRNQIHGASGTWPTATTRDWKGSGPTVIRQDGKSRLSHLDYLAEQSQFGHQAPTIQMDGNESSENDQTLPQPSPKRLNPSFVEWMMGVPIGWTSLKPLATDSFHAWWQNFCGD